MFDRNIKITNNRELADMIPVLKKLIDKYYERPNRRNEIPIDSLVENIGINMRRYYKQQFKHEKDQTDKIIGQIDDMLKVLFEFSEKHKNKHRRLEFRTDL